MSPLTPSTLTFSGTVRLTCPTLASVTLPASRPWILMVNFCPFGIGSLLMWRDDTHSCALFQTFWHSSSKCELRTKHESFDSRSATAQTDLYGDRDHICMSDLWQADE